MTRVLLVLLLLTVPAAAQEARLHIAVTAIAATAELDAIRDGLRDGLIDAGYGRGLRFDEANAQGDPARAAAIAQEFAAQAPDVIVAISTPSALDLAGVDIPRVFVAVDEALHGQVRGPAVLLTDAPPVEDQVALTLAVAPDARTIAVLFDPAAGGAAHAAHFAVAAEAAGRRAVTVPVSGGDLTPVDARAPRAGALFLPAGQALPLMEAAVAFAEERQIPLIAAEADAVALGAVAAVVRDPYATGREAATRLLALLDGEPGPRVAPARADRLIVNPLAAERQGAPLAEALIKRAAVVLE